MKPLSWSNLLRRSWKCALGLALGLSASAASAEDLQWRAATDAAPPPAAAPRGPAVTMLAPVPLPAATPAPTDPPDPFRKVSYSGASDAGSPVIFRAQMSDPPKVLPVGTPDGPEDPPKKKPDTLPAPRVVPGFSSAIDAPTYGPCPTACGAPKACDADGSGHFCVDDCCAPPHNTFWGSAEYLLWWVKGQHLPPLVTAGNPANDIPGALGQPGTVLLFGGQQADDARSGLRLRGGWWLDEEHTVGIDGSVFFLGQQTKNFTAGSLGSPALFRPFLNAGFTFVPGTGFVQGAPFEDAEAVAFPGALAGSVNVRQTSELWGYDANLRTSLWDGSCHGVCWNVDGYAGFRSLGLNESVQVTENLTSLLTSAPGSITVFDKFKADNTFYGGQVGLETELRWKRWFLDLNTRLAMGDVHEVVQISGATTIADSTGVHTSSGGLLAQGTNIGNYSRDRFALVPELGLNVGYQLTDCVRLFVGYNLLYVSNVARPGEQIDRAVNPTQIPRFGGTGSLVGPAVPAFTFHGTDFYAQGLNLGLEFRW
jgi:hypothetical protein